MLLREAKEIMENAGIEVKEVEVMKGGKMVKGLSIGSENVKPTVYESTVENMDPYELLRFVRGSMEHAEDMDFSGMFDRDYVLSHCFSCVRHETGDTESVKFPVYGDLEEYIRIKMDTEDSYAMTAVVTKSLADSVGIGAEELREAGRRNLMENARIQSMSEVLKELTGGLWDEESVPMYVASTADRMYGASVMLLDSLLDAFCQVHGINSVTIIPSSIHEILLLPEEMDRGDIDGMIVGVNESEVREEDRLSNHSYRYSLKTAVA